MENLADAAAENGYTLMGEQAGYQLYHLDGAVGSWGGKDEV